MKKQPQRISAHAGIGRDERAGPGLSVVSMRCLVAESGASYDWHSHPFEEFTLVTEADTTIGYAAGKRPTKKNTLLLYRAGEPHGSWSHGAQTPRFWVLHFASGPAMDEAFAALHSASPEQRVWSLSDDQVETFKYFFLQILNEETHRRLQHADASSAWLRLLLIALNRWHSGSGNLESSARLNSPALVQFWHLVNASAVAGEPIMRQLRNQPNYDSLRHGFRKAFGCSPSEMILRVRMQQAQNLLLDSRLSIKEIAARTGYAGQHEFARAFKKHTGMAASEWRQRPFDKPESPAIGNA
ncbi:MAG: helix-turn-helix domain-containing protein [Limisphaerales bacterium]